MHELMERLEQIERKDKFVGIASSSLIFLILLIALLFWFAKAGLVMGIQEPEWKTIGIIGPGGMDYGTDLMGSGDVNNFHDPSPTPGDRPKAVGSTQANDNPSPSANNGGPSAPTETGNITQTDPSPVNANSGTSESTSEKPNPNATGPGKPNNATNSNNVGGGSNDGETNTVGNHGDPRATVLNPNGLFSFGNGIGGDGGRVPIKTELSGYNVQLEEKIKFEIIIDPNGDVVHVRAPFAINQELVEIGKANIKKWKFSETDPGAGNLKTWVTISFRLK